MIVDELFKVGEESHRLTRRVRSYRQSETTRASSGLSIEATSSRHPTTFAPAAGLVYLPLPFATVEDNLPDAALRAPILPQLRHACV
jgi:hypothetical protein